MSFLRARNRAGLTQAQAAEKLGVDQSAICHWENGHNLPRLRRLKQIADLYGCEVNELLKED